MRRIDRQRARETVCRKCLSQFERPAIWSRYLGKAMKQPGKPKPRKLTPRNRRPIAVEDRLLADVRELIEAARQHVAQAVNSTLVTLYWHVGRRIQQDVLEAGRAAYGEQIVATLSRQLTTEYGRGFDCRNLFYMIRFAEAFPEEQIVNALRTQLTAEYGRGFNRPGLFRTIRFAEVFPDENTVSALRRQLSSEYGRDNSSPDTAGRRPCRSPSPGHRPGDRSQLLPICRPNGPRVRRTVGPLGRKHRFDSANFPGAMPWAGRTVPLRGRQGIAVKSSRRRKMSSGERSK